MPYVVRVVGRRRELAAVGAAVERTLEGRGSVLTVEGDPGAGKTALLDELVGAARGRGLRAVRAGVTLAEQPIAWAGLAVLLDGLLADVAPGVGAGASLPLRRATGRAPGAVTPGEVAFALAALVEELCAAAPIALVVDDVHWLDTATAGALALAIRTAPRQPLLVALGRRTGEAVAVDAARLVPAAAHERLVLDGLTRGETATLVQTMSGRMLERASLLEISAVTRGNPLHVLEVARRLAAGATPDDALHAHGAELAGSLAARVTGASPACREVLLTVALAAQADLTLLARAHPDLDVEAAVAEAEQRQLAVLTGSGSVVRFTHPLLRAAVLDRVGAIERARRHRTLAALTDDAQQQAMHLGAAALRPDEAAAARLAAVGDALLERAAPAEAATALRRAAALSPDPSTRDQRALRAGSALVRAGDYVGAVAVLAPLAAGSVDSEVRATASVEVVLPTAHAAGIADAASAAERALALVPDAARRGQLLRWMVRLQQLADARAGIETARRAVAEAGAVADPVLVAAAAGVLENANAFAGEAADVDTAVAAAQSWTGWISADSPPAMLAELAQWCDLPGADSWLGAYAEASAGSAGERRNVDGLISSHLLRVGRWDEAETALRRIADDDALASTANAPFQLSDLMWLRAQRGVDVGDACAALGAMLDILPPLPAAQVLARRGGAALAAGDVAAAVADLRAARALAVGMSMHSVRVLPFRLELVEALLAAGHTDDAADEAAALERDAVRSRLASAAAEAAAAVAMVAAATRRARGSGARFDDALGKYAALTLPFDEARVRLAAGIAARREGKRSASIAHFDAAADAFARLGALPWAARARAERERAGDRPAAEGELTPTERRIAELVAAGRSNAEVAAALFVSLRTVESNLTRIYRKLGVRSRVQLATRLTTPLAGR